MRGNVNTEHLCITHIALIDSTFCDNSVYLNNVTFARSFKIDFIQLILMLG